MKIGFLVALSKDRKQAAFSEGMPLSKAVELYRGISRARKSPFPHLEIWTRGGVERFKKLVHDPKADLPFEAVPPLSELKGHFKQALSDMARETRASSEAELNAALEEATKLKAVLDAVMAQVVAQEAQITELKAQLEAASAASVPPAPEAPPEASKPDKKAKGSA